MPYELKKISPRRYEVVNSETGMVHAKHTSLKNAKAQIRLLQAVEHGFKPKRKMLGGVVYPKLMFDEGIPRRYL